MKKTKFIYGVSNRHGACFVYVFKTYISALKWLYLKGDNARKEREILKNRIDVIKLVGEKTVEQAEKLIRMEVKLCQN